MVFVVHWMVWVVGTSHNLSHFSNSSWKIIFKFKREYTYILLCDKHANNFCSCLRTNQFNVDKTIVLGTTNIMFSTKSDCYERHRITNHRPFAQRYINIIMSNDTTNNKIRRGIGVRTAVKFDDKCKMFHMYTNRHHDNHNKWFKSTDKPSEKVAALMMCLLETTRNGETGKYTSPVKLCYIFDRKTHVKISRSLAL